MQSASNRKEFAFHSQILTGGGPLVQKARSVEYLAGLAARNELPNRMESNLLEALVDNLKSQNRPVAVRLNALNVIIKLLACTRFTHTATLVDKGLIDVLTEVVNSNSDEMRSGSARAARLIATCCIGCKKELAGSGMAAATLLQLRGGGFDASAEAVRAALEFLTKLIPSYYEDIDPTELVPAAAYLIERYGADNYTIANMSFRLLLAKEGAVALVWQHRAVMDWLLTVVASDKPVLASEALRMASLLIDAGSNDQRRWFLGQGDFLLNVVQWSEWSGSETFDWVAKQAASVLERITAAATAIYADFVLASPAIIKQLVLASDARWGYTAMSMLMNILMEVTAGGPTAHSEYLIGWGFLPRFVRSVAGFRPNADIVRVMITALPIVLRAHPELSRQLHEAGASLPPLQLAIHLRLQRPPQQYIIEDENIDRI